MSTINVIFWPQFFDDKNIVILVYTGVLIMVRIHGIEQTNNLFLPYSLGERGQVRFATMYRHFLQKKIKLPTCIK